MNGGKNAQLGFYYQNIYTMLAILESLEDGLIKASVENKVSKRKNTKEVDLILEFKDNSKKIYEIKSGVEFTKKDEEIRDAILCLYSIYKKSRSSNFSYFLIINPNYKSTIAKRIFQIKTAKDYKKKEEQLKQLCQDWAIEDYNLFKKFCENLSIEVNLQSGELKALCLQKIKKYVIDERVLYTNYPLTEEDLLNKLLLEIINSIQNKDGEIDLVKIAREFINWCAINYVAYNSTQKPDKKLDQAKKKYLKEFQAKFPTLLLSLKMTELFDINPDDKSYENK